MPSLTMQMAGGGIRAFRLTLSGRGASTTGVAPSRGLSNSRGTRGGALTGYGNADAAACICGSPPLRVPGQTLEGQTGRRLDGGSAGAGGTGP